MVTVRLVGLIGHSSSRWSLGSLARWATWTHSLLVAWSRAYWALTDLTGPWLTGAYCPCCAHTGLTGALLGRLPRMAIGLLGLLPQWPPFELTQWPAGLLGTESPCPLGLLGSLGACLGRLAYWVLSRPWLTGRATAPGLTGTWPHWPRGSGYCTRPYWHLALLAPGTACALVGWAGRPGPARDRGSSAPSCTLNRKSSL